MNTATVTGTSMKLNHVPQGVGPTDYRAFAIAAGEAFSAIDRKCLTDLWPAYARMHDAAGLGPMDWARRLTSIAYAASSNPAILRGLKLDTLGRTIGGLLRNVDAEDRLRVWTEADGILRGARRVALNDIKDQIADVAERSSKYRGDLSSDGQQRVADYGAELQRLSTALTAELIACGLISTAVAS